LVADSDYEFRVYALECEAPPGDEEGAPYIYVGIAPKELVGGRIGEEFSRRRGVAAHFCFEHKPKRLLLVWPAANRAVEAYVYMTLLQKLKTKRQLRTLGGWTQTSAKPSPLTLQHFDQSRWCLNSQCFKCGSKKHFARDCKVEEGLPYACKKCGGELVLSSRGQTTYQASSSGSGGAGGQRGASGQTTRQASSSGAGAAAGSASGPGAKRAASAAPSPPPMKVARKSAAGASTCLVVSVCDKFYTSLTWYMLTDPHRSVCARARKNCSETALVLEGGHTRSVKPYAATADQAPRPLCRVKVQGAWRARQTLASGVTVDTEIVGTRVKRGGEDVAGGAVRLSQVLFLVEDLDSEFK
jgi:hypothetical protein